MHRLRKAAGEHLSAARWCDGSLRRAQQCMERRAMVRCQSDDRWNWAQR
jgi:hypothetical protein